MAYALCMCVCVCLSLCVCVCVCARARVCVGLGWLGVGEQLEEIKGEVRNGLPNSQESGEARSEPLWHTLGPPLPHPHHTCITLLLGLH